MTDVVHAHVLKKTLFSSPTLCFVCQKFIWGAANSGCVCRSAFVCARVGCYGVEFLNVWFSRRVPLRLSRRLRCLGAA